MYKYKIYVKYECESGPHISSNRQMHVVGSHPSEINRVVTPVNGVIYLELEKSSLITIQHHPTYIYEGKTEPFTVTGVNDSVIEATTLLKDFKKDPLIIVPHGFDGVHLENYEKISATYYDEPVKVKIVWSDVTDSYPYEMVFIDEEVPFNEVQAQYDLSSFFTTVNVTIMKPVSGMFVGATYSHYMNYAPKRIDSDSPLTVTIPVLKSSYASSRISFWMPEDNHNFYANYAVHYVQYTGSDLTVDYDFTIEDPGGYIDFIVKVVNKETQEPVPNAYIELMRIGFGDGYYQTDESGEVVLPRVSFGYKFRLFGGTAYDWITIQKDGLYTYEVDPEELEKPEVQPGTDPSQPDTGNETVPLPGSQVTLPKYKEPKRYHDFPLDFIVNSGKKIVRSLSGFKNFPGELKYYTSKEDFFSITPVYTEELPVSNREIKFNTGEELKNACRRTHDMRSKLPVTNQQVKTLGKKIAGIPDALILQIAKDNMNDGLSPAFKKGLVDLKTQKTSEAAKNTLRYFMMADKFSQVVRHNFSDYPDTSNDGTVLANYRDDDTLKLFCEKYLLLPNDKTWEKVLKIQYWLFNENILSPGIYAFRNEFGVDYKIAGFLSENFFNWNEAKNKIPKELSDFFLDEATNMFVLTNKTLYNKADSAYKKIIEHFDKVKYRTVISYSDYKKLGEDKAFELIYDISSYYASAFGVNTISISKKEQSEQMLSDAQKMKNERLSKI